MTSYLLYFCGKPLHYYAYRLVCPCPPDEGWSCRCGLFNSLRVGYTLDVQRGAGARADVRHQESNSLHHVLMHIVPANQHFKVEYRARVCYSNVGDKI